MKKYSNEMFEHLVMLIRSNSDSERDWLRQNGAEELACFWDAVCDDEVSFKWLMKNNFTALAAVVDGLAENQKAKLFLLKAGHRELAAFVEACFGTQKAISFLLQNNYNGWLLVAKEIYNLDQKKEKSSFWGLFHLGNPFKK